MSGGDGKLYHLECWVHTLEVTKRPAASDDASSRHPGTALIAIQPVRRQRRSSFSYRHFSSEREAWLKALDCSSYDAHEAGTF
ncbi:UNVERIFIED_CONTAM: hypothetical protein Sangu_2758200 [Sesamum angustifolium]|uniref:Uncharacterized protein n=1 Tax=Sesamum angustifolium TaxID=2727405 RepID=A0AAW2IV10_9LAMI